MKYLWPINKDKIVLSEEGKVDENLEPIQKKNKCKIIMSILKFILVLEIILLVGSAFLLLYKSRYYEESTDAVKMETESNSANIVIPNLKLTGENLNTHDNNIETIDNQQSSLKTDPELLNIHEEKNLQAVKTDVNRKNEPIEESDIDKIKNVKSDIEEKILNDEINSPSEPIFKKIFSFRFSSPLNVEKSEEEIKNSPAAISGEEPKNDLFHFRILFKTKTSIDDNNNNNETNGNIDPIVKNIIDFPENLENQESLNRNNVNNENFNDFDNFLSTLLKQETFSDFFYPRNEEIVNNENDDLETVKFTDNVGEEEDDDPSSFGHMWRKSNFNNGNYEYDETSNFDSQEYLYN